MRPDAASLSSVSLPRFSPFTLRRKREVSFSVKSSTQDSHPAVRTTGGPEPPWFVLPPPPPHNPFSAEPRPQIAPPRNCDIPLSMRMVQMKKRISIDSLVKSALVKAISALVFMISELQRSAMRAQVDEGVLDRVYRDRSDSFVWLFRRVFFTSPDLVVSILSLLARFLSFSVHQIGTAEPILSAADADDSADIAAACAALSKELTLYLPHIRVSDYVNWFDIGVHEGILDPEDRESCVDRRRRAYERSIAEGEVNSMVLSNYAQFLYRIANDHDRAEQYFQWAVMAQPRDAEAMSRYASFLWEERGDIAGAEEMFLEAIETEPWNHHHSSTYAWFLWKTGAVETCYPLSLPPVPEL